MVHLKRQESNLHIKTFSFFFYLFVHLLSSKSYLFWTCFLFNIQFCALLSICLFAFLFFYLFSCSSFYLYAVLRAKSFFFFRLVFFLFIHVCTCEKFYCFVLFFFGFPVYLRAPNKEKMSFGP